jgi:predicted permease
VPELTSHLRFALRQLRRNPGFALTAILTLAIGIGATTAIFSIFYTVLLRPLPYREPEQIVAVSSMTAVRGSRELTPDETSYPNFRDWRDRAHSFESMASYHPSAMVLNAEGANAARNIQVGVASSDFFHVLRLDPVLGRTFIRNDEAQGTKVVVLSHELWVSWFASSPSIVGQTVLLSGEPYTVIGVLPQGAVFPFIAPSPFDLWTSSAVDAIGKHPSTEQRDWNQIHVIARLKRGVTAAQATAEMNTIQRNLAAQYPDDDINKIAARVRPSLEETVGNVQPALHVLFAAVSALLLIACANVAGLLLVRGANRQPEIAVRAALGASRREITLQLLAESLLLSAFGGFAGVCIASVTLQGVMRFLPKDLPRLENIAFNAPALAFAIGVSAITGIVFGLLPARRMARLDPALALRDGTRTSTAGRRQHRLHSALVVTETALGLVLLVGAGLLIRSFMHLLATDPGFNPQHVLTFRVGITDKAYPDRKEVQLYDQLLARLNALPGAVSSTAAFPLPFSGGDMTISFDIQGRASERGNEPDARASVVEPAYFETLQIPLLRGRTLAAQDNISTAPPVIVINQALANKYFPGEDPLGKRLATGFDHSDDGKVSQWREIVGVVADVKRLGIAERPQPEYYIPYAQATITAPYLALRVNGDPASYTNAVTGIVASLDKQLPVYRVRTLSENVASASAQSRFQTLLLAAFAAVALLLAAIGLYAVLSYMVVQRTHEIGLRMALGAQRGNVLTLVLNRGIGLALIGVALGIAISAPLTHFLGSLLYGVKPLDPLTFLCVTGVLLAVSAIASVIPASRAARLDPMKTLRGQ